MAAKVGEWMDGAHAFVFGGRSYDGMLTAWNRLGGPFKDGLNGTPKYVPSRDPEAALEWPNSTLLRGDAVEAVAALKREPGGDFVIMGSGELIGALTAAGLIDVFGLMIHPIVLGTGRRIFADGVAAALRLVACEATPKGVLLATYVRDGLGDDGRPRPG